MTLCPPHHAPAHRRSGRARFEFVLALVLLALISAVAVPRLGRAAAPDPTATVDGDLAVLRSAIELYAADHRGAYPRIDRFEAQLTGTTDAQGRPAAAGYGPYLRAIPVVPIGEHAGESTVVPPATPLTRPVAGAWLYDAITGQVRPNHPAWR